MKRLTKLALTAAATALTVAALSGAASAAVAAPTEGTRTAIVDGGQTVALPPATAGVDRPTAVAAALPGAATSPSSLSSRCFPAGQFLSGAQAAQWLGTPAAGDSPWPTDNANRVWAANGGWVGADMQWAMVNPGGDDMRRVYVFFRYRC